MAYKLLGYVVWKGAKWYLGRRVTPSSPRTKAALAGGALAVSAGALVLVLRRGSDS